MATPKTQTNAWKLLQAKNGLRHAKERNDEGGILFWQPRFEFLQHIVEKYGRDAIMDVAPHYDAWKKATNRQQPCPICGEDIDSQSMEVMEAAMVRAPRLKTKIYSTTSVASAAAPLEVSIVGGEE